MMSHFHGCLLACRGANEVLCQCGRMGTTLIRSLIWVVNRFFNFPHVLFCFHFYLTRIVNCTEGDVLADLVRARWLDFLTADGRPCSMCHSLM